MNTVFLTPALSLTPQEIVAELDRFIVGQKQAKHCVANALRNRWRRSQLSSILQEEVLPKNILMIGPTGVGKTEIARRMAKLIKAPFLKVEATKFTEVGYVGRDVEQIVRDLTDVAFANMKKTVAASVESIALEAVTKRIMKALIGPSSSEETRQSFAEKLRTGQLEEHIIDIEVAVAPSKNHGMVDLPHGIQMGAINIGDIFGRSGAEKTKMRRMAVKEARKILQEEETEKLIDMDQVAQDAIKDTEQNGIVFLDEIDKICEESRHGKVSREGVQRDLIPLMEGSVIQTKHGAVKTDHILFIASGAFHVARPSDLLPELQGRLPIRVELSSLQAEDFVRILKEPEYNLIMQYKALMAVEGICLDFTDNALIAIGELAVLINQEVENIGARRLHTILEKLLEKISFSAPSLIEKSVHIQEEDVKELTPLLANGGDLSKFIL